MLLRLTARKHAGVSGTPIEIRRAALHNMQRLLPKMQLAGYAAAILHPLMRVLDGHIDELRRDAADTICAVAVALGPGLCPFCAEHTQGMLHSLPHHIPRAVFTLGLRTLVC